MSAENKESQSERKIVLPVAEKDVSRKAPVIYRSPCCCTRNRVHNLFLVDPNDEKVLRLFYAHSALLRLGAG